MENILTLIQEKKYQDANKALTVKMNHHQCVRYAIFTSELSLPIWEAKYPKDQRPRKSIETAKLWLVGKATEEDCRKAANEAWNATNAAYATNAAAYATAYATNAAAAAAYAAANAYAAAAGKESTWIKILEYGIKLMKTNTQEFIENL